MTPADAVAAVRPIADQMLPDGVPRERALLAAELARLARKKPEVIATIWDPWACPAALLPWLAWALSVDVWDPAWSEAKKRKVIAASPLVHRLKGTVGAIKRALAAFDVDARIVEWWEEVPSARRGTFRVDLIYRAGGPEFDATVQAQSIAAVRAAKPKSRVFTSRAVVQARGPVHVGAIAQVEIGAIAHPYAFDGATVSGPVYVGATAVALLTATAHPRA